MAEPLVTIGLTCFNAEDTIGRALASACAQAWPNLEIIVVDDVSSDCSAEVVQSVAETDPRVRLIRHTTNTGPAGARNSIIEAARGEFLVFFDDDDESLPARVREQVRVLTEHETRHPSVPVACYASGERRYPNGYDLPLPAIGSRGEEVPNGAGVADYLLLYRRRPDWFYGAGTPSCALMARRTTFAAIGGFDATLRRVEDTDLAIRLALAGGHFVGTREVLFIQYSTDAQDKSPERNLEGEQCLAHKNRDYLQSIGRYYYAVHWPKLRYWHFRRRYGCFVLELLGLFVRNPFAVLHHLMRTGPRRLLHEWRMRRKGAAA